MMTTFRLIFTEPLADDAIRYRKGDVEAVFTIDRSMRLTDDYEFAFYNDRMMCLYHVCSSNEGVKRVGRRSFVFTIPCYQVWQPGNYRMLVRTGDAKVLRFDVRLLDDQQFEVSKPIVCQALSDDAILSFLPRYVAWPLLSRYPGIRQMRQWLVERYRQKIAGENTSWFDRLRFCNNLLLTFRQADSKKSLMRMFVSVVEENFCISVYDCARLSAEDRLDDLFDDCDGEHAIDLSSFNNRFYIFTKTGVLGTPEGAKLAACIGEEASAGSTLVFGGTRAELEAAGSRMPAAWQWIPQENRLEEEAPDCSDMVDAFVGAANEQKLQFSPQALDKLCKTVVKGYEQGRIANWTQDEIRYYMAYQLQRRYLDRVVRDYDRLQERWVEAEDVDEHALTAPEPSDDSLMAELDDMTGLTAIKQALKTLYHRMRFCQKRRSLGLNTTDEAAFHAVFTGNPGTGKTTVAKMLGRIYHSLGLLSKGDVVCVDRTQMVGHYIGGTEQNMRRILEEAKGNVLFIDEAYTLCPKGESNDFGPHAIECLLGVLSQKHPDMIVIMAGYQKEMEEMISVNPGLKGRFPYTFHFADYSADELMEIALSMFRRDDYLLSSEASLLLRHHIAQALECGDETFSNARWVEQYVHNGIIPALADRLAALPTEAPAQAYQRIEACDIAAAFAAFVPGKTDRQKRRQIGFLVA